MKKILLTLALASFALVSVRADLIWYEGFNYSDGAITNVAAGIWEHHSGTVADAFVNNKRLQVANSRSEDVNRKLPAGFTTSPTNLYASFTVNCTNAPTITNYFAHFYVNTSTFHGKAFSAPGSLPNTWKLGTTTASSLIGLVKFLPVDLATNTDYQVVIQWDASVGANAVASIWINPISASDPSAVAGDTTSPTNSLGFGFRQASGGVATLMNITNLAVGTTFEEAATNVWATNAVSPGIVYPPKGRTNFVNNPVFLSGVAAGQGLVNMTYTWLKDGGIYPNPDGNTNTLNFPSAQTTDSGDYQLVATTPYSLSATSVVAKLLVSAAPVPPAFVTQPASTTVYFGQTATFNVAATGPGTITYQWNHYGTNLPGETGVSLSVLNVQTNNGTTGPYTVGVTNENGGILSSNAVLSAIPISTVSIAFLRTLVDGNYLATNSTAVWQATGTVTTFTNLTTGNTSSYYLQDGTAGINIFATLASTFRPAQGDVVTFVGVLSSFNSTLELLADSANNPVSSFTIIGSNAALPAPRVIPFNITNDLAFCEKTLEGSIVMLTNVFFGTNAGNVISTTANTTVTVTDGAGETFTLLFSSQDLDTAGQTLPSFAWSVIGVFNQNLGNAVSPRNQGYQVEVTRFSDIVTDEPPTPQATLQYGLDPILIWPLVAWDNVNYSYGSNYSYSVLAATNVTGPYVPISNYQAAMLGVNEAPANGSTATGSGTVVLSPDQTTITVNMSFSGLSTPATASHIHGPAGAGTNASVLFPFSGVPAATSGFIPEQSFAITPTQVGYLQNGLLYMNVHNPTYPGGEIRDQLRLGSSVGLTFSNTSLTNTTPITATFIDPAPSSSQKFYRVTSP